MHFDTMDTAALRVALVTSFLRSLGKRNRQAFSPHPQAVHQKGSFRFRAGNESTAARSWKTYESGFTPSILRAVPSLPTTLHAHGSFMPFPQSSAMPQTRAAQTCSLEGECSEDEDNEGHKASFLYT